MPEIVKKELLNKGKIAGFLLGLFLLANLYMKVNLMEILSGFPAFVQFFLSRYLPPDFSTLASVLPAVADTVLFALFATYISTILSLMCGLLISKRTCPFAGVRLAIRAVISFLRNVPVLIWASLLVYAFGVGEIVGLIALIFATLGFLARSYSDSINEIDQGKLDALKSVGATSGQMIVHGLFPMFVPALINWTLYSFEINIRASAILGMVGAGGIGVLIQTSIRLFKYHQACAIIILVVMIVLATEFVTNKIRSHVR